MATFTVGSVVLVRFPISDLTSTKLRPSVIIGSVGRDDYIQCQITSNPYGDPDAIEIGDEHFKAGSLMRRSHVRVGKIFTARQSLIVRQVRELHVEMAREIVEALYELLLRGFPQRNT